MSAPQWDLSELVDSTELDRLKKDLEAMVEDVRRFAWPGTRAESAESHSPTRERTMTPARDREELP